MSIEVVRFSQRPDLWERIADLAAQVWPEYNLHGDVLNMYWARLYEQFPDFQFVLYDDEQDEVVAEGHTVPCVWDGTNSGLGSGIDETITRAFGVPQRDRSANTLCALAAEIAPAHRDKRLAAVILAAMTGMARACGYRSLIAPVRPNWKDRYPMTPIDRYVRWTRDDGSAFDPWIRVHVRAGAAIGSAVPRSMKISGTLAEWESWTKMRFPESGDYVFPGGLAPLSVDVDADFAQYWEPNVWLIHPST